MTVLREYDHVLSAAILDELETLPGVRTHGITDRNRLAERVPTVSFTWEDCHPREIAVAVGEQGIFVWDGNYYALAVTERLGLEGKGGMMRIGTVHYNTVEEIKRLGDGAAGDGALAISTVDLHVHTFYSDGRDVPEAVLRRAAALGIETVAITDHDNTNGVRQVQALAQELGQCLIPAIELTCRWDQCCSAPGEGDIDILGYWIDLDDAGFCAFERAALEDIHERVSICCARLTADGYPISIEALFERNSHYAGLQYLIHEIQDRGYAAEWGDAFSLMMRGWRQVRLSRFTIEETIEQIHRAGGVAILAHPTAIECDGHWLQESDVAALAEIGLDGLEIYHPRLNRQARAYFDALAQRFDLLVSGGSDAHGWFDEWKGLGTQPVTEAMVAAIQARHSEWRAKLCRDSSSPK